MKRQCSLAATAAALLLVASGAAIAQSPSDEVHAEPDLHGVAGCGPIAGGNVYYSDAHKRIGIVNPLTGDASTVCGYTSKHMYDIAICPDKTMYGVSSFGQLYEIDPTDASSTRIGSIGRIMTSLVCDVNGTLYATRRGYFYTIDRDDAERHYLGSVGNDCHLLGDLEFDNDGLLYGTCLNGDLLRIDPTDGSSDVVGPMHAYDIFGLGSVNPLFGLHGITIVSQISTSNGALSNVVASSPHRVFFGGATLPSIGACCINGPGTQTPCEELPQWECEREQHAYLGDGLICRPNTPDFCNELFVMMESKSAKQTHDGVEVRWTTSIEADTVGFRVLREVNAGRAKSVEQVGGIVWSAGNSLDGASYNVVDRSQRADLASAYYIVDVDNLGKETTHGPIHIDRVRLGNAGTRRTGR